jgi:hypothetical protein
MLAALSGRIVAVVPGLTPRRKAAQPSALRLIIFVFRSCR